MDPSRRTPLLVHVADGKLVFQADGPVGGLADDAAVRELARSETLSASSARPAFVSARASSRS